MKREAIKDKLPELFRQGVKVAGALELSEAVRLIIDAASALTGSEGGSAVLYDPKSDELVFTIATGAKGSQLVHFRMSSDAGIAGWVFRHGKPALVNDPYNDDRFFSTVDETSGFITRSLMATPLKVGERIIGVLEVVNRDGGYSNEELELLNAFSEIAAVTVSNAMEFENIKHINQTLQETAAESYAMVGSSDAVEAVRELITAIAPKPVTVLITGESGTGKDVVAHFLHSLSPRADKPLVRTNCAALNENLLESELFGYEKGAFTGATQRKTGRFEAADGGTIFLDEIGELPMHLQAKLLRVIEEKSFERMGSNKTINVDVRIITATNRELIDEIKKGNFREDLYFRLNVVRIHLPPLRDRKEDIPLLVNYFLEKHLREFPHPLRSVAPEAMEMITRYDWPGNVRQLENAIEHAAVLASGAILTPDLLPQEILIQERKESQTEKLSLPVQERQAIVMALKKAHGNKSKAARILGISRDQLRYRIKRHSIRLDEYGG